MTEKTPAQPITEQQASGGRPEELFHTDGSDQATNPQQGLYTCLAQEKSGPLPVVITEEEAQ